MKDAEKMGVFSQMPSSYKFSNLTGRSHKKAWKPRCITKMVENARKNTFPQCSVSFRAEISELVTSDIDMNQLSMDRGQLEIVIAVFLKIFKARNINTNIKSSRKLMDLVIFEDFVRNTFGLTDVVGIAGVIRAFRRYDKKVSFSVFSGISLWSFVKGLDVLLCGTVEDKIDFAFNAFDIDGDGTLSPEIEFDYLLRNCCHYISLDNPLMDTDDLEREIKNSLMQLFEDKSEPGKYINLKRFRKTVLEKPTLIESLLPFLPNERYRKTIVGLFSDTAQLKT